MKRDNNHTIKNYKQKNKATIYNLFLQIKKGSNPYSTSSNIEPIKKYNNCEINKTLIFQENKNKSLIYRWKNNINGKTYIGSTTNFSSRFYKYYSLKHILKYKTPIHNALIKYGYSNFTLEILEYCEEINTIFREQCYLDILKPEYNILKTAGSLLGFKHSEETLEKFKNREVSDITKNNLSLAATGRVLTEEEREKISISRLGKSLSPETRSKISAGMTKIIGIPIIIRNIETNEEIEYINLTEAAKSLGVSRTAVKKALDLQRPLLKLYSVATKNK